ncbi:DUF421 domain-containing protein [Acuticoccus sp.]|uniref:DUF421 domain-containing protein n=1 Tax=Acuticoccus sp. TaxID=1904378 RepID=UPI003B52DDA8
MDALPDIAASPSRLVGVAIAAVVAYSATILVLRVAGKRTLADMNAFDFVVNVALGSILASMIVSQSTPLSVGLTALVVLVALQTAVAWLASRVPIVRRAVKSEPTLVVHRGKFLDDAMHGARLAEADVMSAVRRSGLSDIGSVHAVVLEPTGDLSVIPDAPDAKGRPLSELDTSV